MTGYVLVAIPLEERDLEATLGGAYRRYRAQTPRFWPFGRGSAPRAESRSADGSGLG